MANFFEKYCVQLKYFALRNMNHPVKCDKRRKIQVKISATIMHNFFVCTEKRLNLL